MNLNENLKNPAASSWPSWPPSYWAAQLQRAV